MLFANSSLFSSKAGIAEAQTIIIPGASFIPPFNNSLFGQKRAPKWISVYFTES